ncbi:Dyp-type peroxidase [Orbaceae bacterium ESL0721]|nr:Dyp-type peroxidase [Orbaceae bacterium ESL0721]
MYDKLSQNPQPVTAPQGNIAIFLTLNIRQTPEAETVVKNFCTDFPALVRSMLLRDPEKHFRGIIGFGEKAWERLFSIKKPAKLHTFKEIKGRTHTAPSTPADILFHIRADRMDHCFEFARQIMVKIGDAVTYQDETFGFRSFDGRSMIGFIDGTENPIGNDAIEFAIVGDEDPQFKGGSYVIVQRYVHDLDAWNRLPVEEQELAIGRKKFDDLELSQKEKPSNAHNVLTSITDENGNDLKIFRDNLPYGSPALGIYGTYFIGYAKDPTVTERMLHNMFIGVPEGNHDRLLDFSTALTGSLFFVPSFKLLAKLAKK